MKNLVWLETRGKQQYKKSTQLIRLTSRLAKWRTRDNRHMGSVGEGALRTRHT